MINKAKAIEAGGKLADQTQHFAIGITSTDESSIRNGVSKGNDTLNKINSGIEVNKNNPEKNKFIQVICDKSSNKTEN